MSDKVLTINLTEREIDLLHECISTNMETVKRRHDDGWGVPTTFMVAEDDFVKRGMDAREQAKMHSRAAARRNFNLKVRDERLSKTQTHDVWDANDPKNW